jgi:uncharacterized repeat protein (TIGR01451 family)
MKNRIRSIYRYFLLFVALLTALPFSLFAGPGTSPFFPVETVHAAGVLSVEILAGYNLVVDSNVSSPSTRAPSVATVAGRFCNTGDAPLTDVQGFIGDYNTSLPDNSTPGVYPSRGTTDVGFLTQHPALDTAATYAFTHIGGSLGTDDATRYVGTLAAGECRVQYWHFEYPQCETSIDPPCMGGLDPVWGDSVKPHDDLWLEFDIWGTAFDGTSTISADATRRMTMRNEISAMANKIEPNPDGRWFNTEADTVRAGGVITSNGFLYTLGNVRHGFDNDQDFVPDYNAWLQPVGDPQYDPTCFRLIRTSGVLTVTRGAGQPDLIIPFDDAEPPHPTYVGGLYFSNLPADNTGVRGLVYYTFQSLNGPCSTSVSPYQEVASGFDNEKFNADYGTGLPPINSLEPLVTLDKASDPHSVALGGTFTYNMPFQNDGTDGAGLPLSTGGLPVVISDTVPAGLEYVGSSAGATVAGGVTIRYSTDSGQTWSLTDPGTTLSTDPNSLVVIQWWLNDTLAAGATGTATFQARVPATYTGSPFIENCSDASFGAGAPFAEACAITTIQGNNSIGDFVWRDEDGDGMQDATETGIDGIAVTLYWDRNGDGLLDDGDVVIATQDTASGGAYDFTGLPDGNYLVQVDDTDAQLPTGYRNTTTTLYAVDLNNAGADIDYNDADFGFGPSFRLDKALDFENPAYENQEAVYTIDLVNTRPGDGTGQPSACTYTVWATVEDIDHEGNNNQFVDPQNAFGAGGPDGAYAVSIYSNNPDSLSGTGYNLGPQAGNITRVEVIWSLYTEGTWVNDNAEAFLWFNNTSVATRENKNNNPITTAELAALGPGVANQGLLVWDVTAARTWTWSDFPGDLDLMFQSAKQGGVDQDISVHIDALGFRITTDQTCGGPEDTIDPLPLTDTYDPARLEFLSAVPPASSVSAGTITWNNLGPLYAGQTKVVTVTFRALEPPDADGDGEADLVTTENCAGTSGATFLGGQAVNDFSDCASNDIAPTGSIGDTIWNDNGGGGGTANNGIQDGGEQGIPGVTVELYQWIDAVLTLTATTVTDDSGYYLFDGLLDGDYQVVVNTGSLPGSTFTQTGDPDYPGRQCVGAECDDRSNNILLRTDDGDATNDDFLAEDFGYRIPNTLYGNVWEDNDGDGSWEDGENGFSNVTVYLDNCGVDGVCGTADDTTTSTTTAADGSYLFSDLADGTYRVRVDTTTLPAGATWSNTADPEGDLNSQTIDLVVAGGTIYGPYDFGYHRTGTFSLGDTLYTDWNGDGDQDSGEEGIPNITFSLYQDDDGDGVIDPDTDGLIATTTTAADGTYTFSGLAAQSYVVVVDEGDADFPSGYVQTQDPDETGVCTTCNAAGSATLGPDDLTVDFGYHPIGAGSIGDTVWQDDDADGVFDAGESPIAGITVSLYEDSNNDGVIDGGDALLATAETDANGNYLFTGLPAGDYLVDVDAFDPQLPVDGGGFRYVLSTDNDPHDVTLTAGQSYLDADFGFSPGGVIGDFVWRDNDGDGGQGVSEPGISGVTVRLYVDVNGNGIYDAGTDTQAYYDANGNGVYDAGTDTLHETTTDANGLYEFTHLPAGDYVVVVDTTTLPAGFTQTGDPDLTGVCSGGTCDSQSGLDLAAGQVDRSRDFGYRPPGVLGDTVWIDQDADGIRDDDEAGIPYVTVELRDGVCTPGVDCPTTETDSDGTYAFGNLADGTYTVVVDTSDPDFPAGLTPVYDPDTTLDGQTVAVISGGVVTSMGGTACTGCDLDADFGYQYNGPNSLSGTVFHDDDNDAFQDAGETVTYSDVTIYLWDCGVDGTCGTSDDSYISSTTTDANGDYTFTGLPDGRYVVSVNPDAPNLSGSDPTITSSPTTYRTVDLDPGGTDPNPVSVPDQDFGFLSQVDMGDLPAAYGLTLLGVDGARHIVPATGAAYLGSTIPDTESNGVESAEANGDDTSGSDDEDGIVRTPSVNWTNGVNGGSIDVTVGGCGGICYLSGWIDWDSDNSLAEDGDRILTAYPVTNGTQTITFDIPAGASLTNVLLNARFRLYTVDSALTMVPSGVAYNGEVEDYHWPIGPTAVRLVSFTAAAVDGRVIVVWETASEIDNLGFNLYRSDVLPGSRVQLNSSLIPSRVPGSSMGATYSWEDGDVEIGEEYFYWLEDIDIYGIRTLHGPAEVRVLYNIFLPIVSR